MGTFKAIAQILTSIPDADVSARTMLVPFEPEYLSSDTYWSVFDAEQGFEVGGFTTGYLSDSTAVVPGIGASVFFVARTGNDHWLTKINLRGEYDPDFVSVVIATTSDPIQIKLVPTLDGGVIGSIFTSFSPTTPFGRLFKLDRFGSVVPTFNNTLMQASGSHAIQTPDGEFFYDLWIISVIGSGTFGIAKRNCFTGELDTSYGTTGIASITGQYNNALPVPCRGGLLLARTNGPPNTQLVNSSGGAVSGQYTAIDSPTIGVLYISNENANGQIAIGADLMTGASAGTGNIYVFDNTGTLQKTINFPHYMDGSCGIVIEDDGGVFFGKGQGYGGDPDFGLLYCGPAGSTFVSAETVLPRGYEHLARSSSYNRMKRMDLVERITNPIRVSAPLAVSVEADVPFSAYTTLQNATANGYDVLQVPLLVDVSMNALTGQLTGELEAGQIPTDVVALATHGTVGASGLTVRLDTGPPPPVLFWTNLVGVTQSEE